MIFQLLQLSNGSELSCEVVVVDIWHTLKQNLSTCQMEKITKIDGMDATIAETNYSILGLSFYTNKKVFYLPVDVAERFPNLVAYDASECAIKKISKANFVGLEKLRSLALVENHIEKIYSNTFEDLVELEYLWLCKRIF